MSWKDVMQAFKQLQKGRASGEDIDVRWNSFRDAVQQCREEPPYHLISALDALNEFDKPIEDIAILDHGCGTGITVLFLLALGYRNIFGVDIGSGSTNWNKYLPRFGGPSEPRFFAYDGARLEIESNSIDLLVSQQVAEHVSPDVFDAYYQEAGRVLRPGGIAIHQVPHRLTPYDSHTRCWGVHMLPRPISLLVYSALGRNREFVEKRLFLRMPWVHTRMVRRHIGPLVNLTPARVAHPIAHAYYDGPRGLRSFISAAGRLPVIGCVICGFIAPFLMLETKAKRAALFQD
ncbi:MAG: methyltransferase domain-containing protein [Alphaproteobacteria bacterium]|nr:methyltransferase domain-containing protein [Alphaproteobacteria bacterium]